VSVSEPLPAPTDGLLLRLLVLIIFAARKERVFRIEQSKHTFGSKSMRSNVADLLAYRDSDGRPTDEV
jgi:hypothetical protein